MTTKTIILLSFICIHALTACNNPPLNSTAIKKDICSKQWFENIEKKILTGDGQGHGPDLGSTEWKSVVEYRLGIHNNKEVPDPSSIKWCEYIDAALAKK